MTLDQISIGKFSLITRLSQKALRLYDQRELLIPEAKDTITGYRYYTLQQIEEGIRIKMLVTLGFSLSEIATIVTALERGEVETIHKLFAIRHSETQLEIERLKQIEQVLVNQENTMDLLTMRLSTPTEKPIPSFRVLSKREHGIYGKTIGKLIQEIMTEINSPENRRNFVKITGPIMFLSHDAGFKETNADIEVAIPITGRIAIEDTTVELKNLPACSAVSILFTGPYDNVGQGYQALFQYIEEKGYTMVGPTREVYLNHPGQVSNDELLTEIQIPIQDLQKNTQ